MAARRTKLMACALLAVACNDVFGLEPGELRSSGTDTGGTGGAIQLDAGGLPTDPSALGGAAGTPPDVDMRAPCATRSDCREQRFDWPFICRNQRCVDVTSPECPIVMGAYSLPEEPEPLIIGALVASGPLSLMTANTELALAEFNSAGGVPIAGVLRRPLVVLCNDAEQHLDQSLDHLIESVGVPGVLVYMNALNLRHAAARTLQQKQQEIFFLHYGGPDAALKDFDDEGLIWHMLGDPPQLAPTYVPLVERVEQHVNAAPRTTPTRLAMAVQEGNSYAAETAELLRAALHINGAPMLEQAGENYRSYKVENVNEDNPNHWLTAMDIASFRPHIVVSLSNAFFLYYVMGKIELAASQDGFSPPFYVLSHDNTHLPWLQEQIRTNPSLRQRIVGVNMAAADDPRLYNSYFDRLQVEYPNLAHLEHTENLYDMMYFMLYAAAAAGAVGLLDGSALADGMRRLVAGPGHDIGPSAIPSAFAHLTREPSATLSLNATLGPADFDQRTGVPRSEASVWCLDADRNYRYDVLRYNPETRSLAGAFPCFDFD